MPPAIMVNDVLYYMSAGKALSIEVDESGYLGEITSVVSISGLPTENNQANIPFEGAPYIKYQEGLALLMDDEWRLFEVRDNN